MPDSCNGAQLFGPWAIEPSRFTEMIKLVDGMPLSDIRDSRGTMDAASEVRAAIHAGHGVSHSVEPGGIAVIKLNGPLTKHRTSLSEVFGGTSMTETRRAIRNAADDDSISGIMLHIDSPGGTVAGTHDLADDVRTAAGLKPLHAYIEDLGASAAFSIGCQASRLTVNRSGLVGSIGTIMVLHDSSEAADKIGVKVLVISTGFAKGTGIDGTEVTAEQLADTQRMVDSMFEQFRADVMRGRGLSEAQVNVLATGQVWVGARAVELDLADGVGSFDEALEALRSVASSQKKGLAMTTDKEKVGAATVAELRAAFPDDPGFALDAAEKGSTLLEAKAAYADVLRAQLTKSKAQTATAEASRDEVVAAAAVVVEPKPKLAGAVAVVEGTGAGSAQNVGTATERWETALAAKIVAMGDKRRATAALVREQPDLHADYLNEFNASKGRETDWKPRIAQ